MEPIIVDGEILRPVPMYADVDGDLIDFILIPEALFCDGAPPPPEAHRELMFYRRERDGYRPRWLGEVCDERRSDA